MEKAPPKPSHSGIQSRNLKDQSFRDKRTGRLCRNSYQMSTFSDRDVTFILSIFLLISHAQAAPYIKCRIGTCVQYLVKHFIRAVGSSPFGARNSTQNKSFRRERGHHGNRSHRQQRAQRSAQRYNRSSYHPHAGIGQRRRWSSPNWMRNPIFRHDSRVDQGGGSDQLHL